MASDLKRMAALLDAQLPVFKKQFDLQRWKIVWCWKRLEEDAMMRVYVEADYRLATIQVDPYCVDVDQEGWEDQLIRYLRHECLHIVLAPLEDLKRIMQATLTGHQLEIFNEAIRQCGEKQVWHVEQALDGLKNEE
jgi:hypothetical protein